jgi:ankyrin repeat protein
MEYARHVLNSYPLSELEKPDLFGFNWLHATIMRDELEVCKLLIESGFSTTIKNSRGETPLEMAIRMGKARFANVFLASRPEG